MQSPTHRWAAVKRAECSKFLFFFLRLSTDAAEAQTRWKDFRTINIYLFVLVLLFLIGDASNYVWLGYKQQVKYAENYIITQK